MFSPLGVGRCRLGLRPGLVCEVSDLEVKGMSDQFIFLIFKKIIIFLEVVEWTLVVVFSVSPFFKKKYSYVYIHIYIYTSTVAFRSFHPYFSLSLSLFLSVNAHMLCLPFFFLLLCLWYMWAFEP